MVICLALEFQPGLLYIPPLGSSSPGSAFRKQTADNPSWPNLILINLKDENMEKLKYALSETQLPQHWPPNIS